MVEEAREAYGAAKDAYASAGAKGDAADRIGKLAEMLDKLAGSPAATAAPASTGDQPADGAPATAAPADDAAEIAAIQKMLGDFTASLEEGNTAMAMGYFRVEGEAAEQAMDATVGPMLNLAALDAALRDKLGAGLAEMSPMPMGPAAASPFTMKVDDLKIQITGPGKATAGSAAGAGQSLQIEKVGDRWLLAVPDVTGAGAGPMKDMLKAIGDAAAALTPEVKAGKFKTKEEFQMALGVKPLMQKSVPGAVPPTTPPGGGG
jgi:hypothetical protein